MAGTWRRFLAGLGAFLAIGTFIGWIYGRADWGLLAASLLALAWHVRHLLILERALRTRKFDYLRYGDGIWAQIYSRFLHVRRRGRKHKRSYQQLLKEVRNSTNALPDGGIVLNAANEIITCNMAASNLAGCDSRRDRGQRVDNFLRHPAFIKYLKTADFSNSVELESPVRAGVWLNCRLVPYGADQRLLLIRDITERKRLATMRREFVANASHELRTPLTVISGYLDALANDADLPSAWRGPLDQMRTQAQRMNKIVAELLELSRLEATGSSENDESIHIPDLLHAAAGAYAGSQSVAAISVEVQSRVKLRGNVAEIESIISNLLSNAVRHTPVDGAIQLLWSGNAEGAALTVSDSGEGIKKEFIPRVTERFFRIDQGRSRTSGGTGLGLAIVKHVLENHQAELSIQSAPGEGSRFSCRFPADRIISPEPQAPVQSVGPA